MGLEMALTEKEVKQMRAAKRPPLKPTQKRHRTSNAKARRLQQFVRDAYLNMDPAGEYFSQQMGQAGSDIGDPHKRLPTDYTECKNWASYPSLRAIESAMANKSKSGKWAAILKEPRKDPLVVIPFNLWMEMLNQNLRDWN